jgi:hypothetical protein
VAVVNGSQYQHNANVNPHNHAHAHLQINDENGLNGNPGEEAAALAVVPAVHNEAEEGGGFNNPPGDHPHQNPENLIEGVADDEDDEHPADAGHEDNNGAFGAVNALADAPGEGDFLEHVQVEENEEAAADIDPAPHGQP